MSAPLSDTVRKGEGDETGFGTALRRAREAQGLTLRELAQRTAIRRDYLQALEDGALDDLPEATFARAYLRRAARELGLDPEPLLADFDRLIRPAPLPPAPPKSTSSKPVPPKQEVVTPGGPPSLEDREPTLGPVRIALIAVLLVLLVVVAALLLNRPAPAAVVSTAPVVATPPSTLQSPISQAAVPPPVSPQGTVRLSVKSIPDGAVVYLDNRNLGPTPVRSFPVDARARAELRVEAPGRTPLRQTIDLRRGRNLRATLPPVGESASVLTDLNTGVKTVTPLPPPPAVPAPPPASAVPTPRLPSALWASPGRA